MASKQFIEWVERQGLRMRRRLALPSHGSLDPYALAPAMGVVVLTPQDIAGLSPDCVEELLGSSASHWSGGCLHLPDGRAIVVLNPTHADTRKRATLMEELVHIDLRHPPSQIVRAGGMAMRSYQKSKETEAYWVGSAALVTRHQLQVAAQLGMTRGMVAIDCGVSEALVKFREQVTSVRL
jgi:hypothetical protein